MDAARMIGVGAVPHASPFTSGKVTTTPGAVAIRCPVWTFKTSNPVAAVHVPSRPNTAASAPPRAIAFKSAVFDPT
eukprot:520176-Rhodomonas_salina.1